MKQVQPAFHIKPRNDGFYVVYDKDQKQRYKALSREAADQWIVEHVSQRGRPVVGQSDKTFL